MIGVANVVVYNYQYLLDPKVSSLVSRELEKECVVVFDEAHNIDNVCIEALSVNLRQQTLDAAGRNITSLSGKIERAKQTDARRLREEYARLVDGLAQQGVLRRGGGEDALQNPVIPDDILREAVPGNIRRAEHFVAFLRRFVEYLKTRMRATQVEQETPAAFLAHLQRSAAIDGKTLKFCYDRLTSLLKTLEIVDTEEYNAVSLVADFGTLVGTYQAGFSLILEPYDERYPNIPDPVFQLCCLDASLAVRPVFEKFQSVFITSGTLSPIELYPRLLSFNPVCISSLPMTLTRECLVSRGHNARRGSASGEHQVRHARRPGRDSELRADINRPRRHRAGRPRGVLRVLLVHGADRQQVARDGCVTAGDAAQAGVHRDAGRRRNEPGAGQLPPRVQLRARRGVPLRGAREGCRGHRL
jgi:DNA excision repair protein ERCC-2